MDIPQLLFIVILRYPVYWISMDIQPPLFLRNMDLQPPLCRKSVDGRPSRYSSILDVLPPQFQKPMDLRPTLRWTTIDTQKPLYVKCVFIPLPPAKQQEGYILFQQSEKGFFWKIVNRVIFKSSECQQYKSVKNLWIFCKNNIYVI